MSASAPFSPSSPSSFWPPWRGVPTVLPSSSLSCSPSSCSPSRSSCSSLHASPSWQRAISVAQLSWLSFGSSGPSLRRSCSPWRPSGRSWAKLPSWFVTSAVARPPLLRRLPAQPVAPAARLRPRAMAARPLVSPRSQQRAEVARRVRHRHPSPATRATPWRRAARPRGIRGRRRRSAGCARSALIWCRQQVRPRPPRRGRRSR